MPENPLRAVPKRPRGGSERKVKRGVIAVPPIRVELMRAVLLEQGRQAEVLLVCLLAYARLRPGEAIGLEWERVLANTLVIDQAVEMVAGKVKAGKNERNRSVDLLGPLTSDLNRYRLAQPGRTGGLLWTMRSGKPWTKSRWDGWARDFYKPTRDQVGGAKRPYDLRHAFASLLLAEHKSLAEVAGQLGDTIQTTGSTYVHVIAELRGRGRLDAAAEIRAARSRVESEGVRKVCAAERKEAVR